MGAPKCPADVLWDRLAPGCWLCLWAPSLPLAGFTVFLGSEASGPGNHTVPRKGQTWAPPVTVLTFVLSINGLSSVLCSEGPLQVWPRWWLLTRVV